LTVDLKALIENLKYIKKKAEGREIIAIVKAGCYGLGAIPISKAISQNKLARFFGIATLYEGEILREKDIEEDILVLGALTPSEMMRAVSFKITPSVYNLRSFFALKETSEKLSKKISFHLKLDCGMGRLGFRKEELPSFIKEMKKARLLEVEGVFSNLASADDLKSSQTGLQLRLFNEMIEILSKNGINPEFIHLANSAGTLFHPQTRCNLVRPGISMYGMLPSRQLDTGKLKQVLRFETEIIQLKEVPKGTPLGYGATYTTSKREKIGILPIGYADGLPRILSEKGGYVLIKGKKAPFVGRISMDLCAVSLQGINAEEGDKVTLWGKENKIEITPWHWAELSETIPYEIISKISHRVRRDYKN
jgi:alanine racemase